jgi:signal transduction histidine kinase/DNA-binding response OmpR family regulator
MMPELRRILIVDDNEAIHEDIKNILLGRRIKIDPHQEELGKELFDEVPAPQAGQGCPYELDDAYQGEEAIAKVDMMARAGRPYSLVFMDVRMPPGIDGIQTVRRIWKSNPQTEVVLCTAYSDYSWEEILAQLGHSEHLLFIRKPIDAVAIKQLALTLTTKWELDRQNRHYIQSLAESRAQYKSLVNNIGLGVMLVNRQMQILTANTQLKKWFPGLDEEGTAKCFACLQSPPMEHFCRTCPALKTFDDGAVHEIITEARIDEATRTLRVQAFPVRDPAGRVTSAIVVKEDITERLALEERIANAQKMEFLGRIASSVAHDLNNILAGVVTLPDLLLLDMPAEGQTTEYLRMIKDSASRAAAIIEDLLTLSRRSAATHEVINLNQLVLDGLGSAEIKISQSEHPGVSIEHNLAEGLLNLTGAPVHLGKTLQNLIVNAMEAIPDTGRITIATGNVTLDEPMLDGEEISCGDYVMLRITDTGIGIPREDLKRIFEPFYTTKLMGRRSGTGLGLAIVQGTVKDHKGYVVVDSKIGSGTEFTLYFPATREPLRPRPLEPRPDPMQGHGESVLVVDDSQESRTVLGFMLSKLGYKPHIVDRGEQAVAFVSKSQADVVVLDMVLDGGMDGLETYKRLLQVNPGQKALIVSGFARTERVAEALRLGASRFIAKPYQLSVFATALKEALQSPAKPS